MLNSKNPRLVPSVLALAALMLTGCAMAPAYQRPDAPVPQHWAASAQAQPLPDTIPEWRDFVTDPAARRLVERALENNRDLRQSLLNIQAARAQYRIGRADRLPALAAQASGTRQRTPADLSSTGTAAVGQSLQAGVGIAAFELDLFGRVQSLSDAALQDFLATQEAGRTAQLSLVAEVVQAYLAQSSAQRRLGLTQLTLEARQRSLQLMTLRRASGASSAVDYQEALGLAEQAQAELERGTRELAQATNALALLTGDHQLVRQLPLPAAGQAVVQQELRPGMPAELLQRRPDILAAEHQLKGRNADIGAARAAFFPRISLTGFLGSSSAELSRLFEGGQSSWSFAPQLTLPIFDAGRNQANLDLARVRKDMAVAKYEATIQTAFREVSDALVATDTLRREEAARAALAASSEAALTLSEARYRAGLDSHLRYLDAQRSSYANEIALIEAQTQRQTALVSLFRVLGGAWSATTASQAAR